MKKNSTQQADGILLLDKPSGMTSHDVVSVVRKRLKIRRIGHAGTLDPLASGLLILCIGRATRLVRFLASDHKIYRGRITFGIETDTYDSDGKAVSSSSVKELSIDVVTHATALLTGNIRQTPPPFSAKKISGVRSYILARKGKSPDLKPVEVHVHYFKILAFEEGTLDFEAKVSAGTYVRSLAHDLGRMLGCGAHLSSLTRISCGTFELRYAAKLTSDEGHTGEELKGKIIPLSKIPLPIPSARISTKGSALFVSGHPVPFIYLLRTEDMPEGSSVGVYSDNDQLLGVGICMKRQEKGNSEGIIRPVIVL